MSLSRDTRQEKKAKAFLRAQFALKQRFERIDWEEEVLFPAVNELKSGAKVFELDAGDAFELEVENAGSAQKR